jgi:hypothetical protein
MLSGDYFEFTKDNVDNAPLQHGVYELYGCRRTGTFTVASRAATTGSVRKRA